MTKTKTFETGPADEAFRNELLQLLNKHVGHLPADRLLALASYTVGQLVAMQDQRRFNAASVMELVSLNIARGNEHAVSELMNNTAGRG